MRLTTREEMRLLEERIRREDGLSEAQMIQRAGAEAARLLDRANVLAQKWVPNPTISKNEVPAVWREAYRKYYPLYAQIYERLRPINDGIAGVRIGE